MIRFASQEDAQEPESNLFKEKPVDVVERLRDLEKYLPCQAKKVYLFAGYLATRANNNWSPSDFYSEAELALSDLEIGTDAYTSQPIKSPLANKPSNFYEPIKACLSKIEEVIFGKEK